MKKYFYTDKTNRVRMFSDKKIKVNNDILEEHYLTTSNKELKDIDNSEIIYYKNKSFVKKPRLNK